MRNTLQYPITKDEIIDIIDQTVASFDKNLIGDIRPLALSKLRKFVVEKGPDVFYEDFDKRSNSDV